MNRNKCCRIFNHRGLGTVLLVACVVFGSTPRGAADDDLIEFLSGAKLEGKVASIDQNGKQVTFDYTIGTFKRTQVYPYSKIHAVTYQGKRYVLNPMSRETVSASAGDSSVSATDVRRSRTEIEQLIDRVGRSQPDWYESTPLDYPSTLDLSWPLKPPTKAWNNKVNVSQYIWDITNPNPGRWPSGIKLVHHIMSQHVSNRTLLERDMKTLGTMYFQLLQDYPRAAFWFRQARVTIAEPEAHGVMLAECYWRLGSKPMAMEMLNARQVHPQAIKLLGNMGETPRAVQLADQAIRAFTKTNPNQLPSLNLMAGDALRAAGQYERAIRYYEEVLNGSAARNEEYDERYKARAEQSIESIRLYEQTDIRQIADGAYRASSIGYEGPIEVEVALKSGRIESVKITRHKEKQFYAALTDTPRQIIDKQSVKGIDATSRATITSEAVVSAAARALAQGAK